MNNLLEISPDSENAVNIMKSNEHNKFVMYYAPWCRYCKSFMSDWNMICEKVAMEHPNLDVKLVKVDCVHVNGREEEKLGHNPNVGMYPTLRVYRKQANSEQGEDYEEQREPGSILNYLTKNFSSVTPDNKKTKKESKKKKKVKAFGKKKKSSQGKLRKQGKRSKKGKKAKMNGGASTIDSVTDCTTLLSFLQDRYDNYMSIIPAEKDKKGAHLQLNQEEVDKIVYVIKNNDCTNIYSGITILSGSLIKHEQHKKQIEEAINSK